jgi:biopolymer transport protein ExbD
MIIKHRSNFKRSQLNYKINIFLSASDIGLFFLAFFIIIPYLNIDKGIPFVLPPAGRSASRIKFPQINVYMDSNNMLYVNLKQVTLDSLSFKIDAQITDHRKTIISFFVEDSV